MTVAVVLPLVMTLFLLTGVRDIAFLGHRSTADLQVFPDVPWPVGLAAGGAVAGLFTVPSEVECQLAPRRRLWRSLNRRTADPSGPRHRLPPALPDAAVSSWAATV
jgi:hypothetical protein